MAREKFRTILAELRKDLLERLEQYEQKYQLNSENFLHQYEKHGFQELSEQVRLDMHRWQIYSHAFTKLFTKFRQLK